PECPFAKSFWGGLHSVNKLLSFKRFESQRVRNGDAGCQPLRGGRPPGAGSAVRARSPVTEARRGEPPAAGLRRRVRAEPPRAASRACADEPGVRRRPERE